MVIAGWGHPPIDGGQEDIDLTLETDDRHQPIDTVGTEPRLKRKTYKALAFCRVIDGMARNGTSSRKENSRRYYEKHRKEILAKRAKERKDPKVVRRKRGQRRVLQDFVISKKHMVPCADCEVAYPFYVMDFDHVRGVKTSHMSKMIANGCSLEMLEEEIAKCEVVCSNCHRERTHSRHQCGKQ